MNPTLASEDQAQRLGEDAQRRRQEELGKLSPTGLAWLAVVPQWTWVAAVATKFPAESRGLGGFLDETVRSGWCENQPIFVPGNVALVVMPPRRKTLLEKFGVKSGEQEDAAALLRLSRPSGQLRLLSNNFVVTCAQQLPAGALVQATFTAFQSTLQPLELRGQVSESAGDAWRGHDTLVDVSSGDLSAYSAALYYRFNVPESRRAELVSLLSEVAWLDECARVARALWLADRRVRTALPTATRCWLCVARHLDSDLSVGPGRAAERLSRLIEWLLRRGRIGVLNSLLDAATLLAMPLGGQIEVAVRMGRHRLELHYRREIDRRRLAFFVPRAEQIECFERLLDGRGEEWAVHYLGLGGVGKTMLMRYLENGLRDARRRDYIMARVDFDYLSPDYPVRRPAQLLLELGDSLQLHIQSSRAESAFRRFCDKAEDAHKEFKMEPPAGDPLANLHRPEFEEVMAAFCEFLQRLPSPIVLLLDTCEELARLRPNGSFQPAVQATFEILERMHAGMSSHPSARLCVVFAGRRLLAVGGRDWVAKGGDEPERNKYFAVKADRPAERKLYLTLHEIRGFTREEAVGYLRRRFVALQPSNRPNSEPQVARLDMTQQQERFNDPMFVSELEGAILERSVDETTACDFEWTDHRARDTGARYNPFSLSLYADWIGVDRQVDAKTIREGGTDPFIELRIIGRLTNNDVRSAVPVLLLFRPVNRTYLGEILDLKGEALENLYQELCQIEWIDYLPQGGNRGAWLEIDRHLRPRLESYYQKSTNLPRLRSARRQIVEWLSRQIGSREVDAKPDLPLVSAILRLLPPASAARYWQRLEAWAANKSEWFWLVKICDDMDLLEPDATPRPLRAAVAAAYAAARLHTQPDSDVAPLWAETAEYAAAHPDRNLAQKLADRALAGGLAAQIRAGGRPDVDAVTRFWEMAEMRPATNWADAIDALVNFGDTLPPADPFPWWNQPAFEIWRRQPAFSPDQAALVAVSALWAARLRWSEGSGVLGRDEDIRLLLDAAHETEPKEQPQYDDAVDWRRPFPLQDRLRLEAIEYLHWDATRRTTAGQPPVTIEELELRKWLEASAEHLDRPETRWLAARLLDEVGIDGPGGKEFLEKIAQAGAELPDVPPVTAGQRHTRPFFVALATVLSQAGEPDRALALLDRHLPKVDSWAARAAVHCKANILLKHRRRDDAKRFLASLGHASRGADPVVREILQKAIEGSQPARATQHPWKKTWGAISRVTGGLTIILGSLFTLAVLFGIGVVLVIAYAKALPLEPLNVFFGPALVGVTLYLARLLARPAVSAVVRFALGIMALLLCGAGIFCLASDGVRAMAPGLIVLAAGMTVAWRWVATFVAMQHGRASVELTLALVSDAQDRVPSREGFLRLGAWLGGRYIPRDTISLVESWIESAFVFVLAFFVRQRERALRVRSARLSKRVHAHNDWVLRTSSGLPEIVSQHSAIGRLEPRMGRGMDSVLNEIGEPLARLPRTILPLSLVVPDSLAGYDWELAVAKGTGALRELPAGPNLAVYRWGAMSGELPDFWNVGRVIVDGGAAQLFVWPEWEESIRYAWASSEPRVSFHRLERWWRNKGAKPPSRPKGAAFRVCHLLGEPVRTGSGLRFRWAGEGHAPLLAAESLARDEKGFIVVQDLPAEFQTRTRSDRERTRELREFGQELFAGGVESVLVIPPVEPQMAADMAYAIASAVRGNRRVSLDVLLAVTAELRRMLLRKAAALGNSSIYSQDDLCELAWEITLFARPLPSTLPQPQNAETNLLSAINLNPPKNHVPLE
jgi:hypothetical protein